MISTKARYALRVMIDLAEHPDAGYSQSYLDHLLLQGSCMLRLVRFPLLQRF